MQILVINSSITIIKCLSNHRLILIGNKDLPRCVEEQKKLKGNENLLMNQMKLKKITFNLKICRKTIKFGTMKFSPLQNQRKTQNASIGLKRIHLGMYITVSKWSTRVICSHPICRLLRAAQLEGKWVKNRLLCKIL